MTAPAVAHSETSVAAALSIESHVGRLENTVILAIAAAGGATCDETELATGLSHQTCSARLTALHKRGLIYDTGLRRKTRSGRGAGVYAISEKQLSFL